MLQYIIETLTFQLLFLLVYDLFLKKETFFQWNRAYLLLTFLLSLVLPWVKIEALKTTISTEAVYYPSFLWQMDAVVLVGEEAVAPLFWERFTAYEWVLLAGTLVMVVWLAIKLIRIGRLRSRGTITTYDSYTKIVVAQSEVAFSFFKQVFLGDGISKEKEPQILAHELVHIKQWHSLDLLFFELLRLVLWFNPLVYSYQNRMAELHEFIADAHMAKTNKKEQYQLLLSEVFQTQNLSFVNQFFKGSMIKKRIVMLTKQKSKAVYQFKYLLFLPLILCMLVYASCEIETRKVENEEGVSLKVSSNDNFIAFMEVDEVPIFPGCEGAADMKACFREKIQNHIRKHFNYPQEAQQQGIQGRVAIMFTIDGDGNIANIKKRGPHELLENEAVRIIQRLPKMQPGKNNGEVVNVPFSIPITFRLQDDIDSEIQKFIERDANWIPFASIDEAPIFPGCEGAADKKACFREKIQNHIRKHFNYPQEAQQLGIQGRVAIMFTIDGDGNIVNIKKRGPHELLENEAVRIIQRLPKMQPGKNNGEVVNVPFSIPITFKLK